MVTRVCWWGYQNVTGPNFFPPISTWLYPFLPHLRSSIVGWSFKQTLVQSGSICDWLWHHGNVSQTLYNLSLTWASLRTVLPWSYGRTQGDYYFTMASFEYDGTSRLLGCSLTLLLFISTVIHVWHWNLTPSLFVNKEYQVVMLWNRLQYYLPTYQTMLSQPSSSKFTWPFEQ